MRINESELIRWRKLVEDELDCLEELSGGRFIQRTPTDPQKLRDFLSGENQLFGSILEKRIKAFTENGGSWGDLTDDQIFYLTLRLKLAGLVLDAMRRNEAAAQLASLPEPPSPDNAADFCRWLLIETWTVLGEDYLASWVEDFFERREREPEKNWGTAAYRHNRNAPSS